VCAWRGGGEAGRFQQPLALKDECASQNMSSLDQCQCEKIYVDPDKFHCLAFVNKALTLRIP
jgi:hypothetical protein